MSATARPTPRETWLRTADALWDQWVLAEIATELALYLWRTSPRTERATAHDEYLTTLDDEERAAAALRESRADQRRAA